jgi:hypothetical protein
MSRMNLANVISRPDLSLYLSIYLSIYLSVYLSIPPTHLSVCLSVCLPIYGSTALVDLGRFFSFLLSTQSVGLLGRGSAPR